MPSPYEEAATGVKTVFDTEFAVEQFTAIHDCLHESLGRERVDVGISPERTNNSVGSEVMNEIYLLLQFYGLWTQEISPTTAVNPFTVASYAHRLQVALETAQDTRIGTSAVWFYKVTGVDFPRDPTGNKTRFEMRILAYGDAPGLETRA